MPSTESPDVRVDIKALGVAGLANALADLGEPRYRTGQVLRWLYKRGAVSFDDMTDISTALREALAGRFALSRPVLVERQVSEFDGTRKYLWRLSDDSHVESVGLPGPGRLTVCFSTQAGCAMGCSFCATGRGGFVRNLQCGEIVDQVAMVGEDFGERVSNAVAMGQGEPLLNYDAVLDALRIMNARDGLGIGARHLTISTCGILSGIERISTEPEQYTLAVSLHSAVQRTRDELMPGMRSAPLPRLRARVQEYAERTGRRPTFEYALIDGVNDTDDELRALVAFCKGLLCHVNLIPANSVPGTRMRRSDGERAAHFARILSSAGIETSLRAERGSDIDAACGQLTQRHLAQD